jgi:hypothetical protein
MPCLEALEPLFTDNGITCEGGNEPLYLQPQKATEAAEEHGHTVGMAMASAILIVGLLSRSRVSRRLGPILE